jgi:hypothetical protein
MAKTAILVEGASDRVAVTTLAARRKLDLTERSIEVVALGGVTNVARVLLELRSAKDAARVAGLCDSREIRYFRVALERAGLGDDLSMREMETLGFFACDADLEDELIRALGVSAVEAILKEEGDLPAFRTFQNQPYQRDRDIQLQLHRFFGTMGGRKVQYARALVEGLDLGAVPRPLDGVLTFALG